MPDACRLLACACILAAANAFAAERRFDFDSTPGRLPKDVVPLDYDVQIVPDIAAMTIAGTETVDLLVRRPTSFLRFNSLNQMLRDVRLDGRPVQQVQSDDAAQLTTVTLAATLVPGRHQLTFAYSGRIETVARGLFVQHYVDPAGQPALMLSTKMESTDARRMFPCWDEPAFRASFRLTATVPARWSTVSNMPIASRHVRGDQAVTSFRRSPKMPSYLVEFTAGELAAIASSGRGAQLDIWTVRGREHDAETALANARRILADYEDYFDYRYPLPKLDSIAIPGGFTGGMENWGAITYNDQLLLLTAASTTGAWQTVFSTEAHEIAHQWSGDLVTVGWWSDIWLNESFASWMAVKETAQRNPDWHWLEAKDQDKEDAMSADAFMASHAIQQPVTDELQAVTVFDPQITYRKGQALLRMIEAYLGADSFRRGVRSYIRSHAYSNATAADLWEALDGASGADVGLIISGWINQPGYPLVSVSAECDAAGMRTLHLSQQRFLFDAEDRAHPHWSIPLSIRAGASAAPKSALLTEDRQPVPAGRCDEPLSVNAGNIGFYRVRYDSSSFSTDADAFDRLPVADRIALLDDQWALAEASMEPLAAYLRLLESWGSDLNLRAYQQMDAALQVLELDERGLPGHAAFISYARSLAEPAFARLGWDARSGESADTRQLRRSLIAILGAWGDQAIIDEARRRCAAFVQDHSAIAADDQPTILSIVAQYADAATFEQLHALASSAKDETEQRRYYSALMSVADEGLAAQAASIALSPEIAPQAASLRLPLIARLALDHPSLAWSVFTANAQSLLAPFTRYAPLISAQQVPQWFWSGVPMQQLDAWVRAQVPASMADNIERGLQTARFRMAEKQNLSEQMDSYLRQRQLPPTSALRLPAAAVAPPAAAPR